MADLFDALAARALATAPALAPALAPPFAPAADDPEVALNEPLDLTAVTLADQKAPVARRAPDPTATPSRREQSQARDEPEPVGHVGGRHRSRDDSATPDAAQEAESAGRPARPDPPELAPAQSVPPWDARGREPPTAPLRPRVPEAPVEVHGDPGSAPPGRPRAVTAPPSDPIVATLAVRPAEPDAPLDAIHLAPAPGHETPAARLQVTVSIGHVEVRAPAKSTSPAPLPQQQPRWPRPRLSLEDYLRRDGRR
jgi:hypothetical protein